MKGKRVLIGMSGGVDSSVAAYLLKEQGCELTGVFLRLWDGREISSQYSGKSCCSANCEIKVKQAKQVADFLGIPFYVVDAIQEFRQFVLQPFTKDYSYGRTPNPCVLCNKFIKFGIMAQKAKQLNIGFEKIATGHYAVAGYDNERKRYLLRNSADRKKDQTYFLWMLNQEQLSRIIFPLGTYTKEEVKSIVRQKNIPTGGEPESRDFIEGSRSFLFETGTNPGDFLDKKGNVLGRHNGVVNYTIGQRRGTGIAVGKPMYVMGIDAVRNTITLGEEDDCYKRELIAGNINWISVSKPEDKFPVDAKIRYGHYPAKAVVSTCDDKGVSENNVNLSEPIPKVTVRFESPQWAVTPGQSIVFYREDRVIGGAVIEKVTG